MFSFSRIFKYIWLFIKPYKTAFFSLFFLALGRILFSGILTGYLYKNIIDTLNNTLISIQDRYHLALLFVIPMAVAFVISMFMTRYMEWVNFRYLSKVLKNIYDYSFQRLMTHSYGFYNNTFAGSLVAKVKRLVKSFETVNNIMVNTFWSIILMVISSTVALYFQSKTLALYFLVWCIFYSIITLFFVKQKIKIDMQRAEADSRMTGVLADSITNISNIKVFSAFTKEFYAFKEVSTFLKDRRYAAWKFSLNRHALQAFLMTSFHIFILMTMISLWSRGEITVGVFVMAYVYFIGIIDRIWDLSSGLTNFMEALTDAQEMVDIFEQNIEVKDLVVPENSRMKEGVIEFKNVSFGYIEEVDVLSNFNLKIEKGEKIGLVGHSGSGKSTITKLLLRFTDVNSGEILIDGQNISNVTQDDLRRAISYVPQESILFHRSIKENIGYSKDGATDEEIIEAAKKAHAHNFIESMSHGYDSLVGERGIKLSGGERQRVAIARAMLKPAPILVLDEATSSLDSVSEAFIQDAFNELMKNKTTIVIAHRLSTIQKMDRIIVLDKGKIVEEGNHKELLEKNGFYANLWNRQTGGFLEE
ncbi:MAG: ABC transporter ATP-binding protein [Patescibacteria group bacterium]